MDQPESQSVLHYGMFLMAAALLSTIPMLIMFLFLQKHLIAGISLGGVRR